MTKASIPARRRPPHAARFSPIIFCAIGLIGLMVAGEAPAQSTIRKAKTGKPVAPAPADATHADYQSAHFELHTDLSPKEAKELLARLETMLGLISKYWGRPAAGMLELYVVKDLANWPRSALDPAGRAKIEEGAGVTLTQTLSLGGETVAAKAVVYAVADRGTPQHEAVHAYCGQTFGTCGPLWYAEGMAEMGQYWKQGDFSVQCHPEVLKYIRASRPKSLNQIVNPAERELTGDSWQNYAWRWALCHLLANNPNYAERFRPMGLGFLTKQKVSFEDTYGSMAEEISFEYKFFLQHLDQGYRVDLCSWDWKRKFKPLVSGAPVSAKVAAGRGWQPSGVTVSAGQQYEYSASGSWQVSKDAKEVTANGDANGYGRLMAVVFKDFQLSDPIKLGVEGAFKAPTDGKLFLRCQDKWNELTDNKGTLTVRLKSTAADAPAPTP